MVDNTESALKNVRGVDFNCNEVTENNRQKLRIAENPMAMLRNQPLRTAIHLHSLNTANLLNLLTNV